VQRFNENLQKNEKKREVDSVMNQEKEKHGTQWFKKWKRDEEQLRSFWEKKEAQQSWQNPITGL
jgi:hypothetical protein